MKIQTNSFDETQKAGEEFSHQLKGGDVLFLFGNLGAGKTTFMQGLAKGLGIEHRIISPTFIIVRSYEVSSDTIKKLYHIDLYRTETRHDLEGIGLMDILEDKNAVVAIEWPEKFGILPDQRCEIHFDTVDENKRTITITKYE